MCAEAQKSKSARERRTEDPKGREGPASTPGLAVQYLRATGGARAAPPVREAEPTPWVASRELKTLYLSKGNGKTPQLASPGLFLGRHSPRVPGALWTRHVPKKAAGAFFAQSCKKSSCLFRICFYRIF